MKNAENIENSAKFNRIKRLCGAMSELEVLKNMLDFMACLCYNLENSELKEDDFGVMFAAAEILTQKVISSLDEIPTD